MPTTSRSCWKSSTCGMSCLSGIRPAAARWPVHDAQGPGECRTARVHQRLRPARRSGDRFRCLERTMKRKALSMLAAITAVCAFASPSSPALTEGAESPIFGVHSARLPTVGVGRRGARDRTGRTSRHRRKRDRDSSLSERNASLSGRINPGQDGLEARAVDGIQAGVFTRFAR